MDKQQRVRVSAHHTELNMLSGQPYTRQTPQINSGGVEIEFISIYIYAYIGSGTYQARPMYYDPTVDDFGDMFDTLASFTCIVQSFDRKDCLDTNSVYPCYRLGYDETNQIMYYRALPIQKQFIGFMENSPSVSDNTPTYTTTGIAIPFEGTYQFECEVSFSGTMAADGTSSFGQVAEIQLFNGVGVIGTVKPVIDLSQVCYAAGLVFPDIPPDYSIGGWREFFFDQVDLNRNDVITMQLINNSGIARPLQIDWVRALVQRVYN